MEIELLRDVLIETGELDRYFETRAPVALWRAKKKEDPGLFDLVEELQMTSRGLREPDITIETAPDGVKWVRVRPSPRGASTFTKPNVFKGSHWEYYRIDAGTKLPYGLALVRDRYNVRFKAVHYTIAPAFDMTLCQFRSLLQLLATKMVREVG